MRIEDFPPHFHSKLRASRDRLRAEAVAAHGDGAEEIGDALFALLLEEFRDNPDFPASPVAEGRLQHNWDSEAEFVAREYGVTSDDENPPELKAALQRLEQSQGDDDPARAYIDNTPLVERFRSLRPLKFDFMTVLMFGIFAPWLGFTMMLIDCRWRWLEIHDFFLGFFLPFYGWAIFFTCN